MVNWWFGILGVPKQESLSCSGMEANKKNIYDSQTRPFETRPPTIHQKSRPPFFSTDALTLVFLQACRLARAKDHGDLQGFAPGQSWKLTWKRDHVGLLLGEIICNYTHVYLGVNATACNCVFHYVFSKKEATNKRLATSLHKTITLGQAYIEQNASVYGLSSNHGRPGALSKWIKVGDVHSLGVANPTHPPKKNTTMPWSDESKQFNWTARWIAFGFKIFKPHRNEKKTQTWFEQSGCSCCGQFEAGLGARRGNREKYWTERKKNRRWKTDQGGVEPPRKAVKANQGFAWSYATPIGQLVLCQLKVRMFNFFWVIFQICLCENLRGLQ